MTHFGLSIRVPVAPARAAVRRRSMTNNATTFPPSRRLANFLPPRSNIAPDGKYDVDNLDVDSLQLDDPFGEVADFMTVNGLRSASPGQPLSSAADRKSVV